MGNFSRAEKMLGIGFFVSYILAIALLTVHWVAGAVFLFASAWCLYHTNEPGFLNVPQQRNQFFLLFTAFYIPAIFLGIHFFIEGRDLASFRKYLVIHECKPLQIVTTGYIPEKCDRYGGCQEPEEIEEMEYLCRSTNTQIRFSGFVKGQYEE
jgi:hypothetical protein